MIFGAKTYIRIILHALQKVDTGLVALEADTLTKKPVSAASVIIYSKLGKSVFRLA